MFRLIGSSEGSYSIPLKNRLNGSFQGMVATCVVAHSLVATCVALGCPHSELWNGHLFPKFSALPDYRARFSFLSVCLFLLCMFNYIFLLVYVYSFVYTLPSLGRNRAYSQIPSKLKHTRINTIQRCKSYTIESPTSYQHRVPNSHA